MWVAFTLAVAVVTFVVLQKIKHNTRSRAFDWSSATSRRKKRRICKQYFTKYGICAADPHMLFGLMCDVDLSLPPNRVLISFRDRFFRVTRSYLRDLSDIEKRVQGHNVIVLVVDDNITTPTVLHWAKTANIPVLTVAQLENLRVLMEQKEANLRERLFQIAMSALPTAEVPTTSLLSELYKKKP